METFDVALGRRMLTLGAAGVAQLRLALRDAGVPVCSRRQCATCSSLPAATPTSGAATALTTAPVPLVGMRA